MDNDIQDEVDIFYAAEFEDFLRRERLWEGRERAMKRENMRTFLKAFWTASIACGIFWLLLIWRLMR